MSWRSGTATRNDDPELGTAPKPSRIGIAGIVAGSLAAGLVAALVLPFLPVATVDENFATGMVLIGFTLG
jgi:hypothetical protein